ncbi:hotdog fold domain-containing protein [Ferrimonas marina]|uniref:Acyl-coenzyme A thioesterase PaaI, contains HGG motif n=1 Tax=Ferrimonas marina TaxID=299255 RepID=A0A1M5R5C7_9GAMM|nr:hotdog fold domain-containing protein [Ferrimonas marina]SHH21587.1 protein of unknown function [Ferrimonas marina]
MSGNYVLNLQEKLKKWPWGDRLLVAIIAARAPYFRTLKARLLHLEPHHCECLVPKRKAVQNHIGTVHVIAVCNGLELAMGVMAEASIPKHLRWIPKGMSVDYTAKAGSDIRCVAKVAPEDWQPGDMNVPVVAYDKDNTEVVTGTIRLWLSEKPAKTA